MSEQCTTCEDHIPHRREIEREARDNLREETETESERESREIFTERRERIECNRTLHNRFRKTEKLSLFCSPLLFAHIAFSLVLSRSLPQDNKLYCSNRESTRRERRELRKMKRERARERVDFVLSHSHNLPRLLSLARSVWNDGNSLTWLFNHSVSLSLLSRFHSISLLKNKGDVRERWRIRIVSAYHRNSAEHSATTEPEATVARPNRRTPPAEMHTGTARTG